jgi:hypothetical protein
VCWRWGLGVAWSVQAGPSGSLPSAGSWFAVVGGVGRVWVHLVVPGVGVCRGCLSPVRRFRRKVMMETCFPGASLVFLTFLGCLGGLRSAGCEPVAPAGAASGPSGAGARAGWSVGVSCICVRVGFGPLRLGWGLGLGARLSVSIRRSRVCGDVGVSARAQGCPCSWANRDPCAASVGVGRPLPELSVSMGVPGVSAWGQGCLVCGQG